MVVSHHLLRRRARRRANQLHAIDPYHRYVVEAAERGPWRWKVVKKAP